VVGMVDVVVEVVTVATALESVIVFVSGIAFVIIRSVVIFVVSEIVTAVVGDGEAGEGVAVVDVDEVPVVEIDIEVVVLVFTGKTRIGDCAEVGPGGEASTGLKGRGMSRGVDVECREGECDNEVVVLLFEIEFIRLRLCAEWQLVMMLSKPVESVT